MLSIVGGGGSNAPVSIPPLSTRFSRPAPGKVTIGAYGDNLTMIERTEVHVHVHSCVSIVIHVQYMYTCTVTIILV